ncbi:MAG: phenylalanine--tRNA ligase subunit beta [Bacteroidetes bacterium]|nr:phenylalanine--tRNA ligase subunit beta [Bacteroidota bacterium]MCL5026671.1 phenylalanine--tRNA ligase subunit beta [Chloroflexota bacterium]
MRVSFKWLSDFVDITVPADELAHRLTMAGVEVGRVDCIGAGWENIYVGQVLSLRRHPNADRLLLATVDYGERTLTVVTGAQNMKVGDKIPLALIGATLIDGHYDDGRRITLKPSKLRGVVSEGMACSAKELGLSDEHEGILILDPEAQVGRPLADEMGDTILDIEPTPNRGDLLSIVGVAREVAALTGQQVRMPSIPEVPVRDIIGLEIQDPDLCSRYSASLIRGVRIGPSPKWMRDRLLSAEQRPINNVVDVTNYVMLELNQPLHSFDYSRISGGRIIVRRARGGEVLQTLDGTDRALSPDMLVIADARHPVAVAGVMGGYASEVTEATSAILLEAANFNPVSIRRTSQALRMATEAGRRFEKGMPAEQTVPALLRAIQLIVETAGGKAEPAIADCYPVKTPRRTIRLEEREVKRVLGIGFGPQRAGETLASLQFQCEVQDDALVATVPPHRPDVTLPADLIEEVARIVGYDAIPTTQLHGPMPEPVPTPDRGWEDRVRDLLVGCGLTEIVTYSLTSRERMERLLPSGDREMDDVGRAAAERVIVLDRGPVFLTNPLNVEMDCLRTTALGSMLETLHDNLRHTDKDLSLFEAGRVYLPRDGELPEERRVISVGLGGYRSGLGWGSRRETDFFDLKGIVEVLLERIEIPGVAFVAARHPSFHPGRCAALLAGTDKLVVGIIGEVSEAVARQFDIEQRVLVAGLDFELLLPLASAVPQVEAFSRFPALVQDLAIVVDEAVPAGEIDAWVRRAGGRLVRDVQLFDLYRGAPIPEGQKSLAYHIVYQSPDRTLTDEEVARQHQRIVGALAHQFKARVRE